jgi:hypothetical protein
MGIRMKYNKLKQLLEKWLDSYIPANGKMVEYFVNPSGNELKQCTAYCRGIADEQGNLYVISTDELLHHHIIRFLTKKNILTADFSSFNLIKGKGAVALMRYKKTNTFCLSESMTKADVKLPSVLKILEKARKKNRGLTFIDMILDDYKV